MLLINGVEVSSDIINAINELNNANGTQVDSQMTFTFANSAPANNQQTDSITRETNVFKTHEALIHNPSTVSDITVKFYDTFGGNDYLIWTEEIPASGSFTGTTIDRRKVPMSNLMTTGDLTIIVSNDTILGGGDTFIATIDIVKV